MSHKDVVTKDYIRINRIFADAFNYLLYDGRPVIDPDGLRELDSTEIAALIGDGESADRKGSPKRSVDIETVQKYRDVLKYAVIKQDDNASYVILGIENQLLVNYAMPVRNFIYDALQYGRQAREVAAARRNSKKGFKWHSSAEFLSGFCKGDRLKPVITLVIHFGADEWDGPLSLYDMIDCNNPGLMEFVQDYRIHLIDPARLSDEEFLKFSTSLREVLQYIKYSKDMEKLAEITSDNPRMLLEMSAAQVISAVTDTPVDISEEKEEVNMCQAIKEMIEQAKAEGRAEMSQAIEDSKSEGRLSAFADLVRDGTITVSEAAKRVNMSVEDFQAAVSKL